MGDEALAYRAVSDSIERDLRQLEKIKEQLNRLEQVRWEHPTLLRGRRSELRMKQRGKSMRIWSRCQGVEFSCAKHIKPRLVRYPGI